MNRARANALYSAIWRESHPDYQRTWRKAHPTYQADWNRAHPERLAAYRKARRIRDYEKETAR
jgi:hypothetical protein